MKPYVSKFAKLIGLGCDYTDEVRQVLLTTEHVYDIIMIKL